jgi:hypothetical protein
MTEIDAIRILPPLAIGRFGSADEPVDNYALETDPERPMGFRRIVPRPTLIVDEATGEISGTRTSDRITFRTEGRIRPVAPFLEVHAADGAGDLAALTTLRVKGVAWRVRVANRKVFRRTGDPSDIVAADTGWFDHHDPQPLEGRCANFVDRPGAHVNFGCVRFIRPNDTHPELRLRFTPPPGHIYGPDKTVDGKVTNAAIRPEHRIYDHTKGWYGYIGGPDVDRLVGETEKRLGFHNATVPPALFAIEPPAPTWLHYNKAESRGYLDDACDGFVDVAVTLDDGRRLEARARICVGPPDVAPDALFLRSLADDLEQAVHGPDVAEDEAPEAVRARALDIVRRAFETVRFMNTAVMNGNDYKGRSALKLDSMPQEESADTERALRPVMPPEMVDPRAIEDLHERVYAALSAGVAPWFADLMRQPEEVTDFTDYGRRKMPAMMCGADNGYLALTRRQIDTIRRAAEAPVPLASAPAPSPADDGTLKARNLTAQLHYEAQGNPPSSRPATSVANCCPGLEMDFRAAWRRLFEGVTLREYDNLVTECSLPAERIADAWRAAGRPEEPPEDLSGHRLVRVSTDDGEVIRFTARITGAAPSSPADQILMTSTDNPAGLAPLEWSNALAPILARYQGGHVTCHFSPEKSEPYLPHETHAVPIRLAVGHFFADDTAVIAEALAEAGELTQGLCSPWQNDYRECSCYYWASARPDFVNVEVGRDGLAHGDNWLQKTRTGDYVPDDYADPRLILYDDLFADWERLLRFQIGGRDAEGEETDPR